MISIHSMAESSRLHWRNFKSFLQRRKAKGPKTHLSKRICTCNLRPNQSIKHSSEDSDANDYHFAIHLHSPKTGHQMPTLASSIAKPHRPEPRSWYTIHLNAPCLEKDCSQTHQSVMQTCQLHGIFSPDQADVDADQPFPQRVSTQPNLAQAPVHR